jgi:hypothetical protein
MVYWCRWRDRDANVKRLQEQHTDTQSLERFGLLARNTRHPFLLYSLLAKRSLQAPTHRFCKWHLQESGCKNWTLFFHVALLRTRL